MISVTIKKIDADEEGIVVSFNIYVTGIFRSEEILNFGKVTSKDELLDKILTMAKYKVAEPKYYPPLVKDLEGKTFWNELKIGEHIDVN